MNEKNSIKTKLNDEYKKLLDSEYQLKNLEQNYNDSSIKLKKSIDSIFLYWKGKTAIKQISEMNDNLILNKKMFDINISEQLNEIERTKKRLNNQLSNIEKENKNRTESK